MVDAFVADLPVIGVAKGIRLGGHERVGECLDYLTRSSKLGWRLSRSGCAMEETFATQASFCGPSAASDALAPTSLQLTPGWGQPWLMHVMECAYSETKQSIGP